MTANWCRRPHLCHTLTGTVSGDDPLTNCRQSLRHTIIIIVHCADCNVVYVWQCYIFLDDARQVAEILETQLRRNEVKLVAAQLTLNWCLRISFNCDLSCSCIRLVCLLLKNCFDILKQCCFWVLAMFIFVLCIDTYYLHLQCIRIQSEKLIALHIKWLIGILVLLHLSTSEDYIITLQQFFAVEVISVVCG